MLQEDSWYNIPIVEKGGDNMESVKQVLMRRDKMSEIDADNYIEDAKEELQYLLAEGEMGLLESFCEDWFGLEPDYMHEFFPYML